MKLQYDELLSSFAFKFNLRRYIKAAVAAAAAAHGKTTAQVWFRWVQSLGIATLSGTSDPEHMQQDLVRRCINASV